MKRIALTLLTLTALVLTLTGCGRSTGSFEKYVRSGNYAEAITYFQEKMMDNSRDYIECRAMVEDYLEESLQNYIQGKLSQEEFEAVLHTMVQLEDNLYLVDNLEVCHSAYVEVRDSKENFQRAQTLEKSGRLEEAAEAYAAVIPEDTENYTQARENLEKMLRELQQTIRSGMIGAYESGDYALVFQIWQEARQNPYITLSQELTELYEAAAVEYVLEAAERAEQAFGGSARDYNAALEVLRRAMAEVGGEAGVVAELETLAETYKAYIPVSLSELTPVVNQSYVNRKTEEEEVYTDINGKVYDERSVISPTGGTLASSRAETDDESYITYNLNFGYSTFTGTIYRPYAFLTYTGEVPPGRCLVKIFGDDVLLYEFSDPGDEGEAWDVIPVEVDVSGVRNMKIVIRGCWNSAGRQFGGPDWKPGICLGDGTLQK